MAIVYFNYADQQYERQQSYALKRAKKFNFFDQVIGYGVKDIDSEFYSTNEKIFAFERGAGYWIWKAYLVLKTMQTLKDGDYIFYCDSGACIMRHPKLLFDILEASNQDIMGFSLPLLEKQWTKMELLINMNCMAETYSNTNQMYASYFIVKKSEFSVNFFKEFLGYSTFENITDYMNPNVTQCDSFIEHRHDQSIFSLLYKKYQLIDFQDPSQFSQYPTFYDVVNKKRVKLNPNQLLKFENGMLLKYKDHTIKYPPVILLYRQRSPRSTYIRFRIKEFLGWCRLL